MSSGTFLATLRREVRMPTIPENTPENKEPAEGSRETVDGSIDRPSSQADDRGKRGPLDGSTSGTIGGGGRETGGPTDRGDAPDMPDVNPDDAASGRRAPDALGAAEPHDPFKTSRTDVNRE
jgi:hypothetical protein